MSTCSAALTFPRSVRGGALWVHTPGEQSATFRESPQSLKEGGVPASPTISNNYSSKRGDGQRMAAPPMVYNSNGTIY